MDLYVDERRYKMHSEIRSTSIDVETKEFPWPRPLTPTFPSLSSEPDLPAWPQPRTSPIAASPP